MPYPLAPRPLPHPRWGVARRASICWGHGVKVNCTPSFNIAYPSNFLSEIGNIVTTPFVPRFVGSRFTLFVGL